MEALVALALTCNVLQLVSFGRELITVASNIQRDGSANISLAETARRTEKLSNELETSIQNQTNTSSQPHDELLSIARDCITVAKNIKKEMDLISTSSSRFKQTVAARRKNSTLERLDKTLVRHQRALQSRLLYQIYKTQDAAQSQQLGNFDMLDNKIKDLIRQYSLGQIQIQQLVERITPDLLTSLSTYVNKLESLITSEHEKTRLYVLGLQTSERTTQVSDMQRERLLRSLYFETMNQRRTQIDEAYRNTFEWIFKAEEPDRRSSFKTWIRSDKSLFWISGKPGSGKSTLMKYIASNVESLQQLSPELSQCSVYSFFIWNAGSAIERSLRGMYCSLLYQILTKKPDMADQILRGHLHLREHNSVTDWELKDLRKLLFSVLHLHQQSVFLFIDGLDEIDAQEDPLSLLDFVQGLIAPDKQLKICVSSRPEPIWHNGLNNLPSLRLQDLTEDDIRTTAEGLLNEYFPRFLAHKTKLEIDKIVDGLLFKADGVFLWVRLALKSLQRGISGQESEDDLLKRLDILPQGIQSLYRDMWKRLGEDEVLYRQQAAHYFKLILRWDSLTGHYKPGVEFTSFLMLFASNMSVQDSVTHNKGRFTDDPAVMEALRKIKARLETRCAGFLDLFPVPAIDEEQDLSQHEIFARGEVVDFRVRFIHRTARDYLLNTVEGLELLNSWSCINEDLDFSIVKATLCYALIFSSLTVSDFSFGATNPTFWEFKTDNNLEAVLEVLGKTHEGCELTKEGLEILSVLKGEFKSRSLVTFPELVAKHGSAEWVKYILEPDEWEVIGQHGFRSILFQRHNLRYDYTIEGAPSAYDLDNWIADGELDPGWCLFHTAVIPGQSVPIMVSILENVLLEIGQRPFGWQQLFTAGFLKGDFANYRKRVLLHITQKFEGGSFGFIPKIVTRHEQGWGEPHKSFVGNQYCDESHIILETNVAQLVNNAVLSIIGNPFNKEKDGTDPQIARMRSLLYEPEKCFNKILIAGKFDCPTVSTERDSWVTFVQTGRFCEPTEAESCLLLNCFDANRLHANNIFEWLSRGRAKEPVEFRNLVHTIVSSSKNEVIVISDFIRQKGYYTPSQEDVDAYIHAKTFKDKVVALKTMNEKQAKHILYSPN